MALESLTKYFEVRHKCDRVRARAMELEMADAWQRAEWRLYRDLDDYLVELAAEEGIVDLQDETAPVQEQNHAG